MPERHWQWYHAGWNWMEMIKHENSLVKLTAEYIRTFWCELPFITLFILYHISCTAGPKERNSHLNWMEVLFNQTSTNSLSIIISIEKMECYIIDFRQIASDRIARPFRSSIVDMLWKKKTNVNFSITQRASCSIYFHKDRIRNIPSIINGYIRLACPSFE